MKNYLVFLIIIFIQGCGSRNSNQSNDNNSKEISASIKNENINIDFNKESIYDVSYKGRKWMKIEHSAASDTAITFYTYRILFTEAKEEMYDCEIRANLLLSTQKVKELFPILFKNKSKSENVDHLIDSLNQASIIFAKEIVDEEIKKYGGSDGICHYLYTLKEKLK